MSDELVSVAVWIACGLLLGAVLEAERRGLLRGGQTWAKPVKALLHTGGVIQRAAHAVPPLPIVAKVLPSRPLQRWGRRADGTLVPLRRIERNPLTKAIRDLGYQPDLMHPAMATDDAAAATLIADLWRYPSIVEDD